jgi:hypothetical protein
MIINKIESQLCKKISSYTFSINHIILIDFFVCEKHQHEITEFDRIEKEIDRKSFLSCSHYMENIECQHEIEVEMKRII